MSDACFTGDFRKKPIQSFSGVNRSLQRDQLIQHAAQERKQREEFRKHTQFAIKLQSQIRKHLVCQKWHELLRSEFNVRQSYIESNGFAIDLNDINYLGIRFVKFFSYPQDKERLFFINNILSKNQNIILEKNNTNLQWLKYVFKYNSIVMAYILDCFPNNFEEFNIILKLFDTFLSNDLNVQLLNQIWCFLISNDYINNILNILCKIRSIESINDDLFQNAYEIFIYRLLSSNGFSQTQQCLLIENYLSQFISHLNDYKLLCNLLNSLCRNMPTFLNSTNIITSFHNIDKSSMEITRYIVISFATVKFLIHLNSTSTFNAQMMNEYLNILKLISIRLFQYFKTKPDFYFAHQRRSNDNNDDYDDDENDDYDDDDYIFNLEDERLLFYMKELFLILNSTENCNIIVKFVDLNPNDFDNAIISLSHISHLILFFHSNAIHHNKFLHTLAFNSNFLRKMWHFVLNKNSSKPLSETLHYYLLNSVELQQFLPQVTIFAALFNYFLQTLDDVAFFKEYLINDICSNENNFPKYNCQLPFKLEEIVLMSSILRDACISLIEMAYQDKRIINFKINLFGSNAEDPIQDEFSICCWSLLLRTLLRLLRHIYARDIRQKFTPDNHWISKQICITILPQNLSIAIRQRKQLYKEFCGIKHLNLSQLNQHGSPISAKDIINVTLIQELPFVTSFYDRVKIIQSLIAHDKVLNSDEFFSFHYRPSITIRRNYVYEDSFEKFSPALVPEMKKTIRVQLISPLGLQETGVDGGGIFREFLSEALKSAFDPNRGLFKLTNDGLLYPNPSAQILYHDSDSHYYLIGRLLGKAIYENMLIELPLAPFFLAKILTVNSDIEINHLSSLDPLLFKNLSSLKNYPGDVSELGLDFTTVVSDFGANKIEELKPNGSNINVTNQNKIEYIHLMADYKLNKEIRCQCAAFKKGFYNVVDFDWIKMFDTSELQVLISGAQTPIDLYDLINHTIYTGTYNRDHPVIKNFWSVVMEFNENDKRKLLKFVTSCSRPPLLGFKDLCPSFCIQNAGSDADRLPTSSTCMNILKLPEIYDKDTMKEKLMYSINSASGFELS